MDTQHDFGPVSMSGGGPDPQPTRALVGPLTNDERLIHEAISRILREMKHSDTPHLRRLLFGLNAIGLRVEGAEGVGLAYLTIYAGGPLEAQYEARCRATIKQAEDA